MGKYQPHGSNILDALYAMWTSCMTHFQHPYNTLLKNSLVLPAAGCALRNLSCCGAGDHCLLATHELAEAADSYTARVVP